MLHNVSVNPLIAACRSEELLIIQCFWMAVEFFSILHS